MPPSQTPLAHLHPPPHRANNHMLQLNFTHFFFSSTNREGKVTKQNITMEEWEEGVAEIIKDLFETHAIKINMEERNIPEGTICDFKNHKPSLRHVIQKTTTRCHQ